MQNKTLPVKNVTRLNQASQALINRHPGMPGMGLIWGQTGYGKTTATTWLVNRINGVYVRAMATWSPSSMLFTIANELDLPNRRRLAQMTQDIVAALAQQNRPLFIDEADSLADSKKLMETLRDVHDLANVPVILIGMKEIKKKISRYPQFENRIAQWVEFGAADMEDANLLSTLINIDGAYVEECLLSELLAQSRGENICAFGLKLDVLNKGEEGENGCFLVTTVTKYSSLMKPLAI